MKRALPTLFALSIATSSSPAAADVWLELLNAVLDRRRGQSR